ncbi:MAG: isomerase [Planctomycetaceae bacterium]|nr:isomerase [Planctomycetaceae bacterium]
MLLGYNTNGLAHHSLPAALELLAEHGYRSVALTLDHHLLNPYALDHADELRRAGELLRQHEMRSVVETGARFLLDPRRKHHPTLMSTRSEGRPHRVEFLRRAIDAAAALGSECVSLWSGALSAGVSEADGWRRLEEGLGRVLQYAERREVTLGFEPEPGMFVDRMERFAELDRRLDSPRLQLTLDVGHLHCLGETPIAAVIRRWGERIVNVHIEDMRGGVHEHLLFGEGEMEFPPIIAALGEVGYAGGVHVELSRHSHVAPTAVAHAASVLAPLIAAGDPR